MSSISGDSSLLRAKMEDLSLNSDLNFDAVSDLFSSQKKSYKRRRFRELDSTGWQINDS
jgi:hypothetical protein